MKTTINGHRSIARAMPTDAFVPAAENMIKGLKQRRRCVMNSA